MSIYQSIYFAMIYFISYQVIRIVPQDKVNQRQNGGANGLQI